ncbi:Glycerophosphodiester phosphodiesterase [Streptomyces sp. RB5]|uniref:Glycerophosphodiester phosphodiesterase n=1 Tax=Streptomyces smaragdinus TaxID=2585196 RepID=A0A7K0CGA4_9ACTN|nr:glycerophosphodiester phosphodiesterase family protein [Streptomyces smaragdinus]MQY12426.1 Glycerophosphodiester phosphodiesterase [Streptomyces smaragdinus]
MKRTRTRATTCLAGTVAALAALLAAVPVAAAGHDGRVVTVAHRGASHAAPENTLAAVDLARSLGIAWVENDVQRTRDGTLVVLHDPTLARTTDVEQKFPGRAPWKVGDFTWKEISALDAGAWKGPRWRGQRVPSLAQYLDRVERTGRNLVLEVKQPQDHPGLAADIVRTLRDLGWLDRAHVARRLLVQSFDAGSIRTVHRLRPDVRTAFLGTPAVADLPAYARFTDQINSLHTTLSPGYWAAVHALTGPHGRRLEAYAWTVDDPARAVTLARWGADGIITNRPDLVAAALRRAGYPG